LIGGGDRMRRDGIESYKVMPERGDVASGSRVIEIYFGGKWLVNCLVG